MKNKLTFNKFTPDAEFAGVGFAGNMFLVLNTLAHLDNENEKLHVDMYTNECVCTEKLGENCWTYYFEQTDLNNNEKCNDMTYTVSQGKINYDYKDSFLCPDEFDWLKKRFYNSFKIKDNVSLEIDEFYNKNIKNKTTLGVQVRLTDMEHYHKVSPLEGYIERIKSILKESPDIEQVFLATDDGRVINKLTNDLNVPVTYYKDMFRANDENPHLHPYDRFKDTRNNHRYTLGVECLKEIITLSKCDYMLKADVSSISITAIILSEKIKKIYKL